ncbi:RagB/SusD family nutrient uptake outer membrane protein [Mucilaginibacter sp. OK098]|uniref:RagB/SusD family nutrient uptake outer membrane protein n=1 Tax=Mucilaginibacter sp. OK098 TaxID=1855297 RepID=UPI00091BC309|nr:RagB/SusD family nutrient uptake outer membrane protein [Mucilaginibacter sp. OK098]SHM59447.1 Starch-binding associating with outer membrane [Mucilaginibacter sp. OK098]
MKKIRYIKILITIGIITTLFNACKKVEPSTAIDEKVALSNAADIATATIGTYAVLRNPAYVRSGHFLMEYPGDNIAQGQPSSDDLSRCYRYTQIPTGGHATNFWVQGYHLIAGANKVIAAIPDNASADLKQLKGENIYLRAMVEFNLVRIFGRPYTQGNGNNPGVPLLSENSTDYFPARSSVKDVYGAVIADLLKAADMMTVAKSDIFASKEVAYALLSRVYLYMNDNANAIKYADLVINSGRYTLLQGGAYSGYFSGVPEDNTETIFCIRYTKTQDEGFSAIGSMYYSGLGPDGTSPITTPGGQGNTGWGEIYASKTYVEDLDKNPADLRHSFIAPYTIDGVLQMNKKLTPNTPMYYITKYSFQEGIVTLSSPVYLRLAEMYLNKAEANAKLGNSQLALDDVNTIRTRAGIPTLTLSDVGAGNVLGAVLEERRLEFAFEGQRSYDLFRNNLPLVRNYPGTHSLNNVPNTNIMQTVLPTDPRVIFYIPQSEIDINPKLTQNP